MLVAMIFVIIAVLRTNPSWWIEDIPSTIERSKSLELVVNGIPVTDNNGIRDLPTFGTWEIADELWQVPRHISNDVKFEYGTITINRAGIFELSSSIIIEISNYSVLDLMPLIKMRVVKGAISHRYEYSIEQYISNVGHTMYLPSESNGFVSLVSQVIIEITPIDIIDGRNAVTIQYMIELPESILQVPGGLRRVSIDRNTNDMIASISLIAIN